MQTLRKSLGIALILMCGSISSAAPASKPVPALPSRPVSLTVEQYDALAALAAQPAHRATRDVRASYSQAVYNKLQEPSSYITYAVIAGTILGLVIAGGPY